MDGFIGEIRIFAPPFEPKNWKYCQGQILSIAQNQALFAILGTTYGGNGTTNFMLPDLRGRSALGTGTATYGANYPLGSITGTTTNTLTINNLPPHTHTLSGSLIALVNNGAAAGNQASPAGAYFASDGSQKYDVQNDGTTLQPATIGITAATVGSNQPVNNMMPYLVVNYVVCISGNFHQDLNTTH